MKIAVLDGKTLGDDLDLSVFSSLGDIKIYDMTAENEVANRVEECDVVIINKVKLNEANLSGAKNMKLICIAATGYDNVDIDYCKKAGIGVCNVVGYSTHSVAQVTLSMAMSLMTHIPEYNKYVKDGRYTKSGVQNYLKPVYHEFFGKTWGVVGLGNIGRQVARVAKAMGCEVICHKRTEDDEFKTVSLETLAKRSDIISIHVPLTDQTRNMINEEIIGKMKKDTIVINVARGAVCDEKALCEAIKNNKIGGIGIDVYSAEPMSESSPYNEIMHLDNVCLLPHMAWGAYESRVRCVNEIIKNTEAFFAGEIRNRVDLQ